MNSLIDLFNESSYTLSFSLASGMLSDEPPIVWRFFWLLTYCPILLFCLKKCSFSFCLDDCRSAPLYS